MSKEAQSNPEALQDSAQARSEFRQRTRDRLSLNWDSQSNAGEPTQDDHKVIPEDQQSDEDTDLLAQQLGVDEESAASDDENVDGAEAEGLEENNEADGDELAADDEGEESEPEEGTIEFYQQEAQKAVDDRESMRKDYTRKTQAIADLRREVEELATVTMTENSFYVQQAENQLQRNFGQVNFAELKATDPDRHRKALAAYRRQAGVVEQAKQRQEKLRKGFGERIEQAKQGEANLSREILESTITGWGNSRVEELRTYAVETLGYYDETSFNELTDWRTIAMLDRLQKQHTGPKNVKELRKRKGKRPRAASNRQAKPLRNGKGQFTESRKAAFEQPGNKGALRRSFQDRLAAERTAGGTIRY